MPRMSSYPEYDNEQIKDLIMKYIHDKTDRRILYLRFVDGDTLEEIAAKVNLNYTTVWRHVHDNEKELFSHVPGK